MKRISFSRKAILRAIHAAAVALYLAMAAAAHAQTATGDGSGNITVSGTGGNPFVFGPASTPPLASGGTLTISSGASVAVGGSSSSSAAYAIQIVTPAHVANSGSLSAYNNNNFSGGPATTLDLSPLTTSGNVTINNASAGMISASSYMGSALAVDVEDVEQGSVSITNSGLISASPLSNGQAALLVGVYANDSSAPGSITLGNTGTISVGGTGSNGYGAILTTGGSGGISVTNSGTISASIDLSEGFFGEGLSLTSSGSGAIVVNNNGMITGSSTYSEGIGINADASGGGAVSIRNTGAVTASNSQDGLNGIGINVGASGGSGTVSILNSGTMTASASGIAADIFVDNAGTGAVDIANTAPGSLSATSAGNTAYGIATLAMGDPTITNSGVISATSTTGTASAIYLYTPTGTGTVNNSGALTSTGGTDANGIYGNAFTSETQSYIVTNSGAIHVTSTSSAGYVDVNGITLEAGTVAQVTNVGAITATGTGSHAYVFDINADGGSVSVSNSAPLQATSSGGGSYGVYANGVISVSVSNNQTISSTSTSGYASGIYEFAPGAGAGVVTNSGSMTVSGGKQSYGIVGTALNSNISLTNSGRINVTSSAYSALGLYATALNGNATVTNSGALTVSGAGSSTSGIYANAASATLVNSAQISASGGTATFGINAFSTGDIAITNNSGGTLSSTQSNSAYGISANSSAGNVQVNNAAAITTNSHSYSQGIRATGASVNVANTGTMSIYSSNFEATGILASSSVGTLTVTNSGSLTVNSGDSSDDGIIANGTGNTIVSNNGRGTMSVTSNSYYLAGIIASSSAGTVTVTNQETMTLSAYRQITGISASGYLGATVTNSGVISQVSTGGYDITAIFASANTGPVGVTNSGAITSTNNANNVGIDAATFTSGNVAIDNRGSVTITSAAGNAQGLVGNTSSSGGNILITNTGTVTASGPSSASGIYTFSGGNVEIDNAGAAMGTNSGQGPGYGIYAGSVGSIVVNNTGSAIGTTYGIYLANAGTVNNSGLASGGANSIFVPTGSTVNLDGASPVSGLIKGGTDDTSTSLLNFNLAITGNHLAAAEAALNAAIAQYNTDLAAAPKGPGNDVDSEVVTINGIAYQWEDFAGIADALVQGRLYANTPGFSGLGSVLDNLPGNPTSTRILNALGNVPDAGLVAALAELSPKELEVFRNVAFDNNTFNVANVNNHLANLRDGLTGFDSSALTVRDASMDSSLNQIKSHLLAYNPSSTPGLINDSESMFGGVDMKEMKSPVNTMPVDRWSSFISGDVILADLNHNPNLDDADYTTGSVSAGVDYRLDDHFTVGALLAYAHTDADLDNRGSSATVDSYTPGLYASYVDGGWYGNFLGAYTRNAYTEDRNINIPGLTGDNHGGASGNQGSANLTGGYEFQKGAFKFGPVASLQYVHLAIDSIREQGPTALDINNQNQDSLRSLFGLEARFNANVATPLGPMSLTPHVSASWQHEYMDDSQGITSQFDGAGGGSFSVRTDAPDRDSAFVNVGLDATVGKNVTVFVNYEVQAGQSNFFAQSAQGGVKIGF